VGFDTKRVPEGAMFRSRRAGWTMLEIVISTVVLLVALVGFAYGLASSTSLSVATREQGVASAGARAQLEQLRATDFAEVLARYDDFAGNDPAGGVSPGAAFDLPGLTPRPDDADGHVGEIVFPLDDDGALREDLELPRLGMPRDLSGEGDVDALDHFADYRILPVLVRVEWRGAAGDSVFEVVTILKRMRP
jgi:type II secretory pathway pseudopilin PulG